MRSHPATENQAPAGLHVAIIMDGNGRWANQRGLPRLAGHRVGVEAVRRAVEAAPGLGISVLTLYAFSADNWRRPLREVSALMRLLGHYLTQETDRCLANGVRLEAIGRRDRLPSSVVRMIEEAERRTAAGSKASGCAWPSITRRGTPSWKRRRGLQGGGEERVVEFSGARRGPADSHQRRAAVERFPAVGVGLRRDRVHSSHVAGVRNRRLGRGGV